MASKAKLEANRRNAQRSTGPRTAEGKTTVSQNSVTHGLRARRAVLLIENPREFAELCANLFAEWQPLNHTESDLVEQLAVNKWKLARLEAVESQASMQCTVTHLAFKNPQDFKRPNGAIRFPDTADKREADAERSFSRIGQHIARVERSYFRALNTLVRMQDRRLKQFPRQAGFGSPIVAVPLPPALKVAAAGASATPTSTSGAPAVAPARHRRFGGAFLHPSGLPDGV